MQEEIKHRFDISALNMDKNKVSYMARLKKIGSMQLVLQPRQKTWVDKTK